MPMHLHDYLHEDAICMNLEALERDQAIRELLQMLVGRGALAPERLEPAVEALIKREKLGSTAIGRGVAVPHARLDGLDGILIAFGHSRSGIVFQALDGESVHVVFLILAGHKDSGEYVGVMERISHLLQEEDFRRFLMAAKDAGEVVALIREMDV